MISLNSIKVMKKQGIPKSLFLSKITEESRTEPRNHIPINRIRNKLFE